MSDNLASRSSSGLGLVILSHATGVRFPYGMPHFLFYALGVLGSYYETPVIGPLPA